jgi:Domain of unknown function (DUF6456)/Bacterial dnaA protein helix-turn-helix
VTYVETHNKPRGGARRRLPPHDDTARICWLMEAATAAVFAVPVDELRAPTSRGKNAAFARQCAMYLAHVVLGLRYSEIGQLFRRDRTTAAYACALVEEWRDDAAIDRVLLTLERIAGDLARGVHAHPQVRLRAPRPEKPAVRAGEPPVPEIDNFRGQHLNLAERQIATELGRANVTVDYSESPLAWLARRRGRNGRALIEPHQLQAGERLRADFTRAHMMPRTTSNWASPISSGRRGAGGELLAGMGEGPGQGHDQADLHGLLGKARRGNNGCDQPGSEMASDTHGVSPGGVFCLEANYNRG